MHMIFREFTMYINVYKVINTEFSTIYRKSYDVVTFQSHASFQMLFNADSSSGCQIYSSIVSLFLENLCLGSPRVYSFSGMINKTFSMGWGKYVKKV